MPNNPYYGVPNAYSFMQPQQILQVAGAASIKSLKMAPNSSLLAMDTTAPIVWMCVSDGTGTVNATAWDITLHKDPPSPEEIAAEQRLNNIENSILQLQQMMETMIGGAATSATNESNVTTAESATAQSRRVVYTNDTRVQ